MKKSPGVFLSGMMMMVLLLSAIKAQAQSITLIYSFTNGPANPQPTLALGPDGNFYGTFYFGSSGDSTVFMVTTNGALTTLIDFNGTNGQHPAAALTLGPDGNFYGTMIAGGSTNLNNGHGFGTIFRVTTNGTLTTLVNFSNTDGAYPEASLTPGPDGNFYGTTDEGGNTNLNYGDGFGTVFRVTTDGTLTTLANFCNTNGQGSEAALTLGPDGNFYGTSTYGGNTNLNNGYGFGTVFQVTTNGTLTTLVNFNNANGANPIAGLTPGPDGNFYGTTNGGGNTNLDFGYGFGTVFRVTTNGALTTLVNFNNTNGAAPVAGLTPGPDGNFYGTTFEGGSSSEGTVFQVTTSGTLTTLVNFDNTNGAHPSAGLILGPDSNFYGMTTAGGNGGNGTIFRLELPPDFIMSPTNPAAKIGDTATFQCQAFGTAPLGYQWLLNGTPVAGATSSSLEVGNITWDTATNAQFQVVVTNAWGSITSSVAAIALTLGITGQPTNETVAVGSPAGFSGSATGFSPLSYQWYFNNGLMASATNTTLLFNPAVPGETGRYQLVVTNIYGSATSRFASLNVLLQPNSYGISNGGGGGCTIYIGSYPGSSNRLWAATNLMPPLLQWQVIATNVMDTNGLGQFLDTNTAGIPQKFYRLSYP